MLTVTVTNVLVAGTLKVRQGTVVPAGMATKVLDLKVSSVNVPPQVLSAVPPGFATGVATASASTWKAAHSPALPRTSAILVLASARSRRPTYWGMATVDRIPMIATTIISSTRVKPLLREL